MSGESFTKATSNPPLLIDTPVPGYGKVSAVGFTLGERYYWITDRAGSVAMLPASVVEPLIEGNK